MDLLFTFIAEVQVYIIDIKKLGRILLLGEAMIAQIPLVNKGLDKGLAICRTQTNEFDQLIPGHNTPWKIGRSQDISFIIIHETIAHGHLRKIRSNRT